MDKHSLTRITKKYNKSHVRSWEHLPVEVLEAVESILKDSKQLVLQEVKNVDKAELELSEFIDQFMCKLEDEDGLKVPKAQSNQEFDHDFQLKKQSFLNNLLSNELKLIENLKESELIQNNELESLENHIKNFENLNSELQKQNLSKDFNNLNNYNLLKFNKNDLNQQENEVLSKINQKLQKLNDNSNHLQSLSLKLDELNDLLDL